MTINMNVDERIKKIREYANIYDDETVCEKVGITTDERRELFKNYHERKRKCKVEAIRILHEAGMDVETIAILLMLSESAVKAALGEE